MDEVPVLGEGWPSFVTDAAAAGFTQARFDFDALLPTPVPGERTPTVRQFDKVRRFPEASNALGDSEPANEQDRVPFGEWLLQQTGRRGWIGDLAKAAKADRTFPKRGSPEDLRQRLQKSGADGDAFEALEDAELDWAGH